MNVREHDAGLSSVDNALILLCAVAERGSLRVSEAAELLGVSRSTAHRLLQALLVRDFVRQPQPNRPYVPGGALTRIALKNLRHYDIATVARPHVAALAEETGETCHFVQLEGSSVRFVDGVVGSHPNALGLRVGIVLPAHATAGGKAILAALPLTKVRALFPRGVQTLTGNTLHSLEEVEEHLAAVGRAGFATNFDESMSQMTALGAVVRGSLGEPLGAVTFAAPSERLPRARIPVVARRMQRTALAISEALALLPGPPSSDS